MGGRRTRGARLAGAPRRGGSSRRGGSAEVYEWGRDRVLKLFTSDFAYSAPIEHVCHGLFHPGHVILTARGPVVIDWPDAFSGPAALDVARTTVFLRYLGVTSPAEGAMRQKLADGYLREYLARTRVAADDLARCTPLVAFVLLHYAPNHPERDALDRAATIPC